YVAESRLRGERSTLIVLRESAEGIVGRKAEGPNSKERRVGCRTRGATSGRRTSYRWCWPSPSRGGVKLQSLDGKGSKRSRRTVKPKARLERGSGWKRSATGRT